MFDNAQKTQMQLEATQRMAARHEAAIILAKLSRFIGIRISLGVSPPLMRYMGTAVAAGISAPRFIEYRLSGNKLHDRKAIALIHRYKEVCGQFGIVPEISFTENIDV